MSSLPPQTRPKLLVLGLGGIAWSELVARVGANKLPGIAAVLRRGAAMRLIDDVPSDRAAAWATLSTGVLPHQHGVVGLDEAWAGGLRPIGCTAFAHAPIMQRLADAGLDTRSVAWPFTRPGAAWPGVHLDDRYAHATGRDWQQWLLPRDVAPADWGERLEEIRVHPTDVTAELLRPFVPALEAVEQRGDRTLVDLALAIARLSTNHAATQLLLADTDWDATFVFYLWLADLLPRYAAAAPPYDGIIEAAWTLLDTMVAITLTAVPRDTLVVLLSLGLGGEAGFVAAAGAGVTPGVRSEVAHSLDVVPSLLAAFGLRDPALGGRALFGTPPAARLAPPARDLRPQVAPDATALARARAAGLQPPAVPAAWRARRQRMLATLALPHDPAGAVRLAEAALAADGDEPYALGILAAAAVSDGRTDDLPPLADRIEAAAPGHVWAALVRAGWHAMRGEASAARPLLLRVEEEGGATEWMRAGAAWLMLDRPADARRAFELVLAGAPQRVDALVGLGIAEAALGPAAAERTLKRALAFDPASDQARAVLHDILTRAGRTREAEQLEQQGTRYRRDAAA